MLRELIFRFRPVVYLHSDENYFPTTIETILENSKLYQDGKELESEGQVNQTNILDLQDKYGLPLKLNIDSRIWGGTALSGLAQIPFYVKVYQTSSYYVIQYIFNYPYNGPFRVCGKDIGEHQYDMEHITVYVNRLTEKINKIYFSAHGRRDGKMVLKKDIQFEDDRPVIYSAKYSHACYWKAKTWWRLFCCANDHTNKGIKWDPNHIILLDSNTPWANFEGDIGAEPSCVGHSWYGHEDGKSTNCFFRLVCCW